MVVVEEELPEIEILLIYNKHLRFRKLTELLMELLGIKELTCLLVMVGFKKIFLLTKDQLFLIFQN